MKIKITKKTLKGFTGDDGEDREYFWYTGERENGLSLRFGSVNGEHEEGKTYDLTIEEYEQSNGRKGYKELTA